MRFHMGHMAAFVALSAFAFAVLREPRALVGLLVPLIGWLVLVLPVLGTIELLAWRSSAKAGVSWQKVLLVFLAGSVAATLAVIAAVALLIWVAG